MIIAKIREAETTRTESYLGNLGKPSPSVHGKASDTVAAISEIKMQWALANWRSRSTWKT